MELLRTDDFYIFVKGEHSLWWDRLTGVFVPKSGWELTNAEDPVCLGIFYGIIGKVEYTSLLDARLVLIKECAPVGKIHGSNVIQKIKTIAFVQLGSENVDIQLEACPKHSPSAKKGAQTSRSGNASIFDLQKNVAFTKTWGTLKHAGNTIKNTTQQAAAIAAGKKKDVKDKDRFEKRIVEELCRIFTDTDSFYFCTSCDITSSLQRLCALEKDRGCSEKAGGWRTVDDRFFWNKYMLKDLIESDNPLNDPWIMPVIQGYVQVEDCKVELSNDYHGVKTSPKYEIFTLSIISRRSRFRAGTRYKRRGVDEEGECANYVETEQIVSYHHHEVSFLQLRGSVPVYWSQPGYKYRPPPKIDKGDSETQLAFAKHFNNELKIYGPPICIINLVEQSGKERIIWDAYSNHVFEFDNPDITYCTFDFHEYCRGMHFENVSVLINGIADIIQNMNYCWRDKQGQICSQVGIFRVNCIDCLDRTNVVQTALGKAVMEIQFTKLGLISPEGTMPTSIKKTFQLLWANNGDIISKQYAGTNALKGDYTRTGERKFTGIMKDGVNSANRYYKHHFEDMMRQSCLDLMLGQRMTEWEMFDSWWRLRVVANMADELLDDPPSSSYTPHIALEQEFQLANALYYMFRYYLSRFKDATRQGTIDLMLGNCVSEDIFSDAKAQDEEDSAATAEHVKLLIEDCKKMLLNSPELVLGAWGLINADPATGDPTETEMDSILILTKDSYFVADYDDQVDKITKYQRVMLKDMTLLECGMPEGVSLFKPFKSYYSIRINYQINDVHGYYHMFRSTNLRFFNNMAVTIKNEEEGIESLKAICEAFVVGREVAGLPPILYIKGNKMEKRKSKVVGGNGLYLDVTDPPNLTRNVSESQLLALKAAGSKALSNVTQQFSKFNKITSPFVVKRPRGPAKPKFTVGKDEGPKNDSSSESEEEYENSIFQPNAVLGESLRYATGDGTENADNVEEGVELTEETILRDAVNFLPAVGIVMGSTSERIPIIDNYSSNVDNVQLSSVVRTISIKNPSFESNAPEIRINEEKKTDLLKLSRKLSRSSSDIDIVGDPRTIHPDSVFVGRSTSEQDLPVLNISQSQSESALKYKLTNLASPMANVTKDLVLNPFSKLAKGVQNLGSNWDPRKFSIGGVRHVSDRELEEHRRLQVKWRYCKTRLIAL